MRCIRKETVLKSQKLHVKFKLQVVESNTLSHTSLPCLHSTLERFSWNYPQLIHHNPVDGFHVWKTGSLDDHHCAGATSLLTQPGTVWFCPFPHAQGSHQWISFLDMEAIKRSMVMEMQRTLGESSQECMEA